MERSTQQHNLLVRDLRLGDVVTYQRSSFELHRDMHVTKKDHKGITLYRPYMRTDVVSPTEARWTMGFEELWFPIDDKSPRFRMISPVDELATLTNVPVSTERASGRELRDVADLTRVAELRQIEESYVDSITPEKQQRARDLLEPDPFDPR